MSDSDQPAHGAPFFLVDEVPGPGPFVLTGDEGRHAATVRRLRTGEAMLLSDGAGLVAPATVTAAGRGELLVEVGDAARYEPPPVRVTLVQAVPKGDRGELAVELATEAGVDAVVPWAAHRCVARWSSAEQVAKGVARWQAAARAAAKQSRRHFLPPVRNLATTEQVAGLVSAAQTALVLHESAEVRLQTVPLTAAGEILLIVGPEGGVTEQELTGFTGAGARSVRLGPQVLRTSTAGAVALGALGALTTRWS